MNPTAYFMLDRPGTLEFSGSEQAQMYTKILSESLTGVLNNNYYADERGPGFISASIEGRYWDGTFWSRDVGTFIRELTYFGYFGHAALSAEYLIDHCGLNESGFYTFPEHASAGEVKAGHELDGTSAVMISMALLNGRLRALNQPLADQVAEKILAFATCETSPLRYMIKRAQEAPLIAGTGEFGGGCGVEGSWFNVVQNALASYALHAWADELAHFDQPELSSACRNSSDALTEGILTHLTVDGKFVWCIDPKTLKADPAIVDAPINKGFGGLNGVGAMCCDVPGLENEALLSAASATFDKLMQFPPRREQFDKYGMFTQFDVYCRGLLSSPSYGHGYALQLALLLGRTAEASRMFEYMARATVNPPAGYPLTRTNPYWTYERFLSPDYFALPIEQQDWEEGCGALNLVNVAEPLKAARLVAGLEHRTSRKPAQVRWLEGVDQVRLKNWPVFENRQLYSVTEQYDR